MLWNVDGSCIDINTVQLWLYSIWYIVVFREKRDKMEYPVQMVMKQSSIFYVGNITEWNFFELWLYFQNSYNIVHNFYSHPWTFCLLSHRPQSMIARLVFWLIGTFFGKCKMNKTVEILYVFSNWCSWKNDAFAMKLVGGLSCILQNHFYRLASGRRIDWRINFDINRYYIAHFQLFNCFRRKEKIAIFYFDKNANVQNFRM